MIIRMCGDGEVHGEKLEIQATGTGKARVVKLLRLLGDGSVAGEIVVAKSQVAGLHDDAHRANESKEQRECRMRYLDQVFDRLVDIKLSQGSAAATITDTIQNPEPIVLGRSRLGNGVLAR